MNKKWIAALAAMALAMAAFAAKPKTPSYLIVQKYGDITMVHAKDPAAIPADLVIPDGVTYIGNFQNCTSLKSVTIPDSVTTIVLGAFSGCTSLTSITIPNSVTEIGTAAFHGCPNSLTVNFGGTKAQWYAIHGNGTESISPAARNRTGRVDAIYGSGTESISVIHCTDGTIDMTQIPAYLIMRGTKIIGCDKNKLPDNLVIPEDVTEIGSGAFEGCTSLKSVSIPSSVTTIGAGAFKGRTSLTAKFGGTKAQWNVLIGENSKYFSTVYCTDGTLGMAEIPAYLVMEGTKITGCDKNKLPDNLVIPEGVTEIGESAFKNCTYLESVKIPNTVTVIGDKNYNYDGAFAGCTSLKSINIPDSVTYIGTRTFNDCVSLTNVTIGKGVTQIGSNAFSGCTSLASIVIPDGVTQIGPSAFYKCTSLKNIVIPNSVTTIENWAFQNCTSLASIAIPNSVTEIGNSAFSGCTSLKSIVIPDSVTRINDWMFKNCTSLVSVTIGSGVTSIGSSAFEKCTSLTSIVIPRGVTSIGETAFGGCTSLKSVSIPRSVTDIYISFVLCPNLSVQYDGTKAQWEAISKTNVYGNSFDKGITIRCTDGNIIN